MSEEDKEEVWGALAGEGGVGVVVEVVVTGEAGGAMAGGEVGGGELLTSTNYLLPG